MLQNDCFSIVVTILLSQANSEWMMFHRPFFDWRFVHEYGPEQRLLHYFDLPLFSVCMFLFERELVNTDGITLSIMTARARRVSPVASLHLNNRSTAVFKKLITFLGSRKG